jgi:phosphatidylserine/phosphatidylglycerophosphate/cardiolipin synthase-like enzyme
MRFRLLLAALFLGLIPSAARSPLDREPSMAGVRLFLGPSESLPVIDVDLIARARQEIDLAAYVLTDRAVTDALQQAASRGIRLRLYLDPDQANRRNGRSTRRWKRSCGHATSPHASSHRPATACI